MGVVMSFPAITSALRSLSTATKTSNTGGGKPGDELSLKTLKRGTFAALILFFAASYLTQGVTVWDAVLSAIVGSVWLALAALIVAQATGMTDISPMSGMTLISVTLMMVLLSGNIAAAMVVGVAVCVAIGQGADMMQDLKTGHMIGARPRQQQIVQFCSTWLGALVALAAVYVLWQDGTGFGSGHVPAVSDHVWIRNWMPLPDGNSESQRSRILRAQTRAFVCGADRRRGTDGHDRYFHPSRNRQADLNAQTILYL